MEKDSKR